MTISLKSIEKPIFFLYEVLVVNGNLFSQFKQDQKLSTMYGFEFANWKESLEISQTIHDFIVGETFNPDAQFFAKSLRYFEAVQLPSLSLFIGLFIAIIFFMAAGVFCISVCLPIYMKKGKNIHNWRRSDSVKKKW